MSRYFVDKVMRQVIIDEVGAKAFADNRESFLDGYELEEAERDALRDLDYKTLYAGGAHPFLLNSFLMRVWPGDRRALMGKLREDLAPLGYPDFSA